MKAMNIEEESIIREAQRGNMMAFEALVKQYDRSVFQIAHGMVSNTHDVEDIYQEVFVRVFRNLNSFNFKSEFSTWLYRVTVNTCINFQRRKKRTDAKRASDPHDDDTQWGEKLEADERNPEESLLNIELSQEIEWAIEQLSGKQKAVFLLKHYHGNRIREIAETMHCSEGTVKNYLFRATQKLQRLLMHYATT
jgi:RNA polymerase sigma-70 factor (ECF subfamily)